MASSNKSLRIIRDNAKVKARAATNALVKAYATGDAAMVKAYVTIAQRMFALRLCFTTADGLPEFGGSGNDYQKHISEHVRKPLELKGVTNYDSLRVQASGWLAENMDELVAKESPAVQKHYATWKQQKQDDAKKRADAPKPDKAAASVFSELARAAAKNSRKNKENPDGIVDVVGTLATIEQGLKMVRGRVNSEGWKPNSGDVKRWTAAMVTISEHVENIGTTLDGAAARLAEAKKNRGSRRNPRTGTTEAVA